MGGVVLVGVPRVLVVDVGHDREIAVAVGDADVGAEAVGADLGNLCGELGQALGEGTDLVGRRP